MTVAQVLKPEWFGNHSWILPLCLFWIGVSLLLWLSQMPWVQRHLLGLSNDTAPQGNANNGAYAGRDNTGNQISHSTVHIGASLDKSHTVPPEQSGRNTNLISLPIKQEIDAGQFASGRAIFLIPIENRLRDDGTRISPAESVSASIRFKRGTEQLHLIKRAYWAGSKYSTQTIAIHDVKHLVLGSFDGSGMWIAYDNPGVERTIWLDAPEIVKPPQSTRMTIGWDCLTAEIRVFDGDGEVHLSEDYRISLKQGTNGQIASMKIERT